MQKIFTLNPNAPNEAAAEAPAKPVPTTMTSNFLLLAGFTNFWSHPVIRSNPAAQPLVLPAAYSALPKK